MNLRRLPLIVLLASFLITAFSFGVDLSPELEEEARQIETMLIAPCCWRQPVSDHPSGASDEIKAEVRGMLAAGLGRDEIVQKYVAEYGERILSKPPAEGFGSLAYFLPVVFLVGGALLALAVIRKLRPAGGVPEVPAAAKSAPANSSYSAKLEKELWG